MFSAANVSSKVAPIVLGVGLPVGAQLVNLSNTDRVWVAQSPGLASGNGTPLDPLASMEIANAGMFYAILDTGAANPVTVLVTDELNGYSNPVALASAVAAELLATGIPLVIREDTIFAGAIVKNTSQIFDVSAYTELTISDLNGGGGQSYQFLDALGNIIDNDRIPSSGATVRLAVPSSHVKIVNSDGGTAQHSYVVIGSNRQPQMRYDVRGNANAVDLWTISIATVDGNNYQLAQVVSIPNPKLVGPCFATISAGGASSTGSFRLDVNDLASALGPNNSIYLGSTAEMYAQPGGGARRIHRMIAIPALDFTITYECRGAGDAATKTFSVALISAQL